MSNPPNDHDILTTLVANLSNLKDSQTQFHKEVKDSFKELKDNYSDRISHLELNKADKIEVEKINSVISRLAWFIVLAVIGAILALILK